MKLRLIFHCLLVFLLTLHFDVQAQITTTISKNKISLDEVLYVTYNYSGENSIVNKGHLSFKGFQVVSAGEQMSNFQDYSFSYVLQPLQAGSYKIPGMTIVTEDGKQHVSKSLTVEVVAGSGNRTQQQNSNNTSLPPNWRSQYINTIKQKLRLMSREEQYYYLGAEIQEIETAIAKKIYDKEVTGELRKVKNDLQSLLTGIQKNPQSNLNTNPNNQSTDIQDNTVNGAYFIRAEPTKNKVYIGEPIEVIYKFYFTTYFTNGAIHKLPQLEGFNSREYDMADRPRPYGELVNGRRYSVVDVKKSLLFPNKAGRLVLDPIVLTALTEGKGRVEVMSDSVFIDVLPLPETTHSAYFTGGVGTFGVSTSIDKVKFTTDDMATLYFVVAGKGNWEIIDAPIVDKMPDHINMGSPVIETEGDPENLLFGKKIFKYNLAIDEAGIYEIPSIPFTFFDPSRNEYVTIKTEPISIQIDKGVGNPPDVNDKISESGQMHALMTGELPAVASGRQWPNSPLYYAVLGMILAGIPFLISRNRPADARVKTSTQQKANKVALARLKMAQGLLNNPKDALFYEEISKSIWLYLSDKLGMPMSELSKENLQSKLAAREVEEPTINKTLQLIQECEMALYAGMHGQQQKAWALDNAMELITAYESKL